MCSVSLKLMLKTIIDQIFDISYFHELKLHNLHLFRKKN